MSFVGWFKASTTLITLIKYVPVNSAVCLLIRKSDRLCRMHSLSKPIPSESDIVPLLVEPKIESSDRGIASLWLEVSRFRESQKDEPRSIRVKVCDEAYTFGHAVERKVYVEVAKFVRRYIMASEEEKKKLYESVNLRFLDPRPVFLWVCSLLEQIRFDPREETVIPFSIKITEREYEGTRLKRKNYYIIYLGKISRRLLLDAIKRIYELAGVPIGKRRERKRRDSTSKALIVIQSSSIQEHSKYVYALRTLNKLVDEGKAAKLTSKVYVLDNLDYAIKIARLLRSIGVKLLVGKITPIEIEVR